MNQEEKGISQFHKGEYTDALETFTQCLSNQPPSASSNTLRIHLLLNRSACFSKLKEFQNVVTDCNAILQLDPKNSKALGKKIKALCDLRDFQLAQQVAETWMQTDPDNPCAQKEVDRLNTIVNALNVHEDEDLLDVLSHERVPPEGQEAADKPTTKTSQNSAISVVACSNNLPDLNQLSNLPTKHPKMTKINITNGDHSDAVKPKRDRSSDAKKVRNSRRGKSKSPAARSPRRKMTPQPEDHDENTSKWKFRSPPRGLTAQEYSLCSQGASCRFGDKCTEAHSEEELEEWRMRFTERQKRTSGSSYANQLMEKWMSSKNPQTVMVEEYEGVNIHCSSNLTMVTQNKQSGHVWLFTVTSKTSLHTVALFDDTNREHFHISMITVGPKKQQKTQYMDSQCQEWINNEYIPAKSNQENVYRVRVQFSTTIFGTFRQSLVLDFGHEPVVVRHLEVKSGPVSDLQKLQMDLELSEQGRWDLTSIQTIKFEPRPFATDAEEKNLLERYPAPLATKFSVSDTLLQPDLTEDNYRTRMHHLLYIEEMAQFSSVAKFNVKSMLQLVQSFHLIPSSGSAAKFAQGGELFARLRLNAELSEDTAGGRLILQNCNTVYLAPYITSQPHSIPGRVYEALVEDKGKTFIMLRLSKVCVEEFGLEPNSSFYAQVQFQLNRLPLCEWHLAIDVIPDLKLLFPSTENSQLVPWNPSRQWSSDIDSRLNLKQKEAIVAITTDVSVKLLPILLIGPYGTGKTFTLAQATLEILKDPDNRVLICTHSNSAADLYISDYLHPAVEAGNTQATPLRIFYRHRWVQTVSHVVRSYSLIDDQTLSFKVPTKEDVLKHRVIVTSLSTSRYLHNLDLPQGFFTHILLDEAAQAMECETILPLALAGPNTRVVLAGDHMQLSPEVHSEFARDRLLHVSFLERLFDLYPADNQCHILLCENYRSHKAIIDFTSELFYENRLVASGNQPAHPKLYPLSFFTARGEDIQHQNSTGFYNNAEVYEVVERIAELQNSWPDDWGPLNESSIGVVSPYSDQVMRIRSELRKRKMFKVSVERVLNVQGKQFRVIFLSVVRTSHTCRVTSAVEDKVDFGFLSNAKLLNTAITRAQSLVAVIGDPVGLCSIGKCRKLWERFIDICHKHSSLNGITWTNFRAHLDGVELKKTYILNPLAPEFIPNRLRHACYQAPEPIAIGKYGYTFTPQTIAPHVGNIPIIAHRPQVQWPLQINPYNPQVLLQPLVPVQPPYGPMPQVLLGQGLLQVPAKPDEALQQLYQGYSITQSGLRRNVVYPPVIPIPQKLTKRPATNPLASRPSNIQFLPNACNIKTKISPLQAELLGYMQQTEGDKAANIFLRSLSQGDKSTRESKGLYFCSDLEQQDKTNGDAKPPSRPSSLPWAEERNGLPLYMRGNSSSVSNLMSHTSPAADPPHATPVTPFRYPAKSPSDNPFFPRPDTPTGDNNALELLKNLDIRASSNENNFPL